MRDYINNHEQLLESSEISENELTYVENELGVSNNYRRVLGLNWNIDKDIFVFEFSDIAESGLGLVYTKRNILKISASFFDPLGLVCPVVLQAKLLFQELCELKVDWDEVVDGDVAKKWDRFLKDLKDCRSICMPRFVLSYVCEKIVSLELHGFCDSSNVTYAPAVYVRVLKSVGAVVDLLSAKSKVSPLRAVTMPWIELLPCLLLSKLVVPVRKTVEVEVEIGSVVLLSDPEISLY